MTDTVHLCENCGGVMEPRREGRSEGMFCTKCDWAVVTTYTPPIMLDKTTYEVRIVGGNYRDALHVKTVAHLGGMNFLAARKLLRDPRPMIFKGRAPEVLQVRNKLAEAGLRSEISPEFRWEDSLENSADKAAESGAGRWTG